MSDEKTVEDNEQDPGIPLWAVELGCWTMVALAPFLYWVNGPAVSTDQLVMRSGLVGFALGGGIVLRLVACSRRRAGGTADAIDPDGQADKPAPVLSSDAPASSPEVADATGEERPSLREPN